jgi:uridine phosphorylase
MAAALQAAAHRAGAAHTTGVTASAPGFFGAGSRYIEGLRNTVPNIKGTLAELDVGGRRVVNMEMESSLLFHLAGALGHRAGTICPVIGQPGRPDVVVDYRAAVETAIDVAVAAMVSSRTA